MHYDLAARWGHARYYCTVLYCERGGWVRGVRCNVFAARVVLVVCVVSGTWVWVGGRQGGRREVVKRVSSVRGNWKKDRPSVAVGKVRVV